MTTVVRAEYEHAAVHPSRRRLAVVSELRRIVVVINVLVLFAWVAYLVIFVLEVQGRAVVDTFELAVSYGVVVGAVLVASATVWLVAVVQRTRYYLYPLNGAHLGMVWAFWVVAVYAFVTVVAATAHLHRRRGDTRTYEHANLALYGYQACAVAALAAVFAVAAPSGQLTGIPPPRAWRHTDNVVLIRRARNTNWRRDIATKRLRRNDALRTLYHHHAAVAAAAVEMGNTLVEDDSELVFDHQTDAATSARHRRLTFQSVFTAYPTMRRVHFLVVVTFLHVTFLVVMALLALLQSQQIAAIPNLWAFTVVYGVVGLVLLVMHTVGLLMYARKHPELTTRHMTPLNTLFVTTLFSWAFTLFVLAWWLHTHAPGACCAADAAHVVVGDEPAWALYNSALAITATSVFTVLMTFVPAVAAHANPERRFRYSSLDCDGNTVDSASTSSMRR